MQFPSLVPLEADLLGKEFHLDVCFAGAPRFGLADRRHRAWVRTCRLRAVCEVCSAIGERAGFVAEGFCLLTCILHSVLVFDQFLGFGAGKKGFVQVGRVLRVLESGWHERLLVCLLAIFRSVRSLLNNLLQLVPSAPMRGPHSPLRLRLHRPNLLSKIPHIILLSFVLITPVEAPGAIPPRNLVLPKLTLVLQVLTVVPNELSFARQGFGHAVHEGTDSHLVTDRAQLVLHSVFLGFLGD